MKSEGILLDLDNTVYDYKRAHEPAIAGTLQWLSIELNQDQVALEKTYAQCRKRVNQTLHGLASSHSRLLYFQGVCEAAGRFPNVLACEAEDVYWTIFFENMQLRPGFHAFLEAIKLPIAIVTDLTARIQFEKIAHLELNSAFKAIVTSEESGHEKPHGRIFELAAEKLKLPLKNLCLIGDSYERDIEGGLALGLDCYWLNPVASTAGLGTHTGAHICAQIEEEKEKALRHNVTIFDDFVQLIEMVKK